MFVDKKYHEEKVQSLEDSLRLAFKQRDAEYERAKKEFDKQFLVLSFEVEKEREEKELYKQKLMQYENHLQNM